GEALRVASDDLVHLVGRRIEGLDLLARLAREALALHDDRTDLVLGLAHSLVMAAHAGNAVGHGQVLARRILHDVGRTRRQGSARGRVQVVGLEPVRQAEDGLTTVMREAVVAARAERMLEQALLSLVAGEVVRGPEVAVARGMTLDQPVVAADARL